MKIFLEIAITYNILCIAFSYYRYKKGRLSKWVLETLIFSFLLYADLLFFYITGSRNCFTIGIAACWCIAYAVVCISRNVTK